MILEGPPGVVAPPALHSVQEPRPKKQSSATPVRAPAWLCGAGGGWGEWMVLGRGEDGFAGDGLGEEVVVVGVWLRDRMVLYRENEGAGWFWNGFAGGLVLGLVKKN